MERSNSSNMKIGRYDVVGLLATGGMAEIFLARQTGPSGFERPVVIKRVLPHLARETVFRDMFVDEARLVVNINHPNVVQVHELGDHRGDLFLVMEYLEGESVSMLAKRLRENGERLPDRAAVHIVAEACAGLHGAHELSDEGKQLGLVHRDVSPHNLFALYSGQVKVIDFGIAKAADRTSKTKTGTVKGKFAYMAPEQVRAEDVDRRADVFALGVVLHELVTGKSLFQRDNDLLVMQALCLDPIPSPRVERPDLDVELERIIMKALSRSVEDRYQTANALRRDLMVLLRRMAAPADAELPEEELSVVMKRSFGDRIAGKAEMLRRVRAGQALTRVIGGDTDGAGAAPIVVPETATGPSGTASPAQVISVRSPTLEPAKRRPWLLIVGAAVLVAGGVGLGLNLRGGSHGETEVAAGAVSAMPMAPEPASSPAPTSATETPATAADSAAEAQPSAPVPSASVEPPTKPIPGARAAPPRPPKTAAPAAPTATAKSGFGRYD
ncbi:MAG: protein kinase [Polyangiaceae bacterium]|nr:protein kinase [Polyangiaceae bacterium]